MRPYACRETWVSNCQSTLRNITEERKPRIQRAISLELWIRHVKQLWAEIAQSV